MFEKVKERKQCKQVKQVKKVKKETSKQVKSKEQKVNSDIENGIVTPTKQMIFIWELFLAFYESTNIFLHQ